MCFIVIILAINIIIFIPIIVITILLLLLLMFKRPIITSKIIMIHKLSYNDNEDIGNNNDHNNN